jgi:DNA polymerase I-like protein with 3'-5' exonuclease and polymerase domains
MDVPVKVTTGGLVLPDTKLILALGNESAAFLAGESIIPKNRTVHALRGLQFAYKDVPVFLSYSPDVGEINHKWEVDLLTDTAQMIRLYKTGSLKPKYGEYRWVEDFSDVIAGVEAKFAATGIPVDVAHDKETRGLDPWFKPTMYLPGGYIICNQFAWEKGKCDCTHWENEEVEREKLKKGSLFREQQEWLLNTPKISLRGANLKYDLIWEYVRSGLECTNFKFDTTLVGCLLDEDRTNSLDVHTKIYVPELGGYSDEFDAAQDKARFDLIPKQTLIPYTGGDGDATLQVATVLKKELLADPKLAAFYVNVLHPGCRAFEKIERGGVLVDLPRTLELQKKMDAHLDGLLQKAKMIVGGRIVAKHFDNSKRGDLNLTKPSMLVDFLFSPMGLNLKPRAFTPKPKKDGTKVPSTAMDNLLEFEDNEDAAPFIELLKDYSKTQKARVTYIGELGESGFLQYLRSDGRYHPVYWLFTGDADEDEGGTVTGRLSCKCPAFQTVPKHHPWAEEIRKCFIAPPGMLLMERDYSQGELKIVACIAGCKSMLEIYAAGKDLHVDTAAFVSGMTYDQLAALEATDKYLFEETRQKGKAGNFGLVYGMSACGNDGKGGFVAYAKKTYRVIMAPADAEKFRAGFFAQKPELVAYHKEYKAFAHANGYVRTPMGRIRHLWLINSPLREIASKAERQAVNSPVQGALSDMMIWSLALEDAAGYTKECPGFGVVHDAGYNYVPEDNAAMWGKKHKEIMQNLPFERVGWHPQLQFTADVKVGPNMGELSKLKC